MKGLENQGYLIALIGFNIFSLVVLYFAVKKPVVARVLFFFLFVWASATNWTLSQTNPSVYLDYADLTFFDFYRDFINGWFSTRIPLLVGIIAACQGLIALSMCTKGWIFKTGCIGAIIFFIAIAPFGTGSGFPCTIFFAIAMWILLKKSNSLLLKNIFHKQTITHNPS